MFPEFSGIPQSSYSPYSLYGTTFNIEGLIQTSDDP